MVTTAELEVKHTYKGENRTTNITWIGPLNGIIGVWQSMFSEIMDDLKTNPDWGLSVKKHENGVVYCEYVDKNPPKKTINKDKQPPMNPSPPSLVGKEACSGTKNKIIKN